jgi:hypothetical protein
MDLSQFYGFIFLFIILNFNTRSAGMEITILFFFMNLLWSHDLGHNFNRLAQVDFDCFFFILFLIDFFF